MSGPKLTVAMITMNEENAVAKVINDIRKAAPSAEILLVDSSKDKTAEIATEMGTRVIKQFPPKGYGPAMDLALRSGNGDVVITLDCDDTYPAEKIPMLYDLIVKEGYDIIDASRLKNKPKHMPWLNYFANFGFALIASIFFGKRLTDLHSGMRAYRKSMIDKMTYKASGAALPVELLLRPLKDRYKMKVVYIDYKERIGESSMMPLQSAWWTLKRILSVKFS